MTREDKLIQRIEQGDFSAANELITIYYPEILRYCIWHVPDRSLAEDAVQETFLKAIRYFDRYTHRGKFKPFLYRIAANTCIDICRKNRHPDISLEESAVDPCYCEPAFEAVRSDMVLRQLVDSLPKNQREIVLLRFGQDLTLREIAGVLNLPLRTVQSRLRSALKRLKAEIVPPEKEPAGKGKKNCEKGGSL
ncbi:MAG: sigma-70 family RNA polymerase sigma factor [Lachnospiraceae bacterium]|nr:sigma-70 family RNA polymerase sigma factor [Lachnospiraceae bacterium]